MEILYWFWGNIIAKLWPPLVAVVLTQLFIEIRKPKLNMQPEGMKINPILIVQGVEQSPYPMWRVNYHRPCRWLSKTGTTTPDNVIRRCLSRGAIARF